MLLDPSELAEIQSIGASGMAGTATILTRVTVVTDDGQQSEWATVGDDVSCWIYQNTGPGNAMRAVAGAVAAIQQWSVRVPIGSAVNSGDMLAIGGEQFMVENTNAGETYSPWLDCTCRSLE